jgi:RND family efflux transporter MFP subunit
MPREAGKGVLITAAKAEMRPVERSVAFVGELQAEEEATIKAEVKGRVETVKKNLGDSVKKGELIARLDSEEYRIAAEQGGYALRETQSRYDLALLNWERSKGLFEKGMISQRERDEAGEALVGLDAALKEKHAALDLAMERVKDTEVVAPISGVIKERFVNPGDYVEDKGPIVSVVSISPLKLKASVPERVAGLLSRGQKVNIRVEAFPGKTFEGAVARISPSVDPKSRTLTIEAIFPNKEGILKPGFFAEGMVVTKPCFYKI